MRLGGLPLLPGLLLPCLLLPGRPALAADSAPALAPGLEQATLEADLVELDQGIVTGIGGVRASFGSDLATAERFRLDTATGVLELWEGSWQRAGALARFARAEIDLDSHQGQLSLAVIEGAGGRLQIEGEALSWSPDGTLSGRGLRLTTCACDSPPWELSARQVDVDDRAAAFRGGLLRVCGLPVLPVPAGRIPLADRASGLLPPELGWGRDGLLVGLPVYLVAGPKADLTLTPELRTARGGRLLAETRWAHPGGDGQLRLAGGWDGQTAGLRGAANLRQGLADGPWRLATDARVEGDAQYLSDYGDGFLARSLPWAETRLVAGLGPLRLEHDGIQALGDGPSQDQQLGAAVVRLAGQRLGPASLDVGARIDAFGVGVAAWQLEADPVGLAEADLRLTTGRHLGLTRLEAEVAGAARSWTDGSPWLEGRTQAGAWLPGWLDLGNSRIVGELGGRAALAGVAGQADTRLSWQRADPTWVAGPDGSARLLTSAGVPISAGGWLGLSAEGLAPTAWLRAQRGPWALQGTVEDQLQDARLGFDDGVVQLGAGVAHLSGTAADRLLQSRGDAAWRLPGLLSEWRPGYRMLLDIAGGQTLSHGPSLVFSSRCGCLDAVAGASWSADRAVPDLGLSIQVR